ncbi:glycosyltransferase [bacterium]|nr:glycosyltransferase [bacterium]
MKGAVTISILLPTHNRAATTTIALQSLLGQSFQDWEVLVVGDGCDDGTGELVKAVAESDPRVRWFDLPKGANFGYANRNIALREARGELIGFLADDDLYFFSHVERLVALMKDPAVQLGVSSALWVDTSGHMIPVVAPLHDAGYRARFLDGENRIAASSFVHRREVFDEVGYWREDLPKHGDLDLWHRIIARYGEDSVRTDPRHSLVHFRAPWKRAGVDPDPHDFGTWQQLIESQRLDAQLKIATGENLLQERLWEFLIGGDGYAAGSQCLELAAARTLESFAFASMDEVARLSGEAGVPRENYEKQVARAEKWKAKQREALARAERWKARADG